MDFVAPNKIKKYIKLFIDGLRWLFLTLHGNVPIM